MNRMMPLHDFPFGNFTPDGSKQLTPALVLVAHKGFIYSTAGWCALLGIALFFLLGRVPAPALDIQRVIDVAQSADSEHNAYALEGRAVATTVERIAHLDRDGNDGETENGVLHVRESSTMTFHFGKRHDLLSELASVASPPARLPPNFVLFMSIILGTVMCFGSCSQVRGDVVCGEGKVAIEHVQEGRIALARSQTRQACPSFPTFLFQPLNPSSPVPA
ncbi:hypothetical protein FIBSPDRAFT_996413 [Athelia psychrophila]|uniref:Uncharacterized protein n=1 Tax=Athelia psychrophila TaxID=1759441 RepID=A0A165WXV7_9AGAM|nr:hypothetical protein FIBSPDRAFT_996413 [Fibularhizoctonia sp. CBS 109695]